MNSQKCMQCGCAMEYNLCPHCNSGSDIPDGGLPIASQPSADMSYRYRRPTVDNSFPFTSLQYGRLLRLRSKVQDGGYRYDNELVLRDADRAEVAGYHV